MCDMDSGVAADSSVVAMYGSTKGAVKVWVIQRLKPYNPL
jgi:hypothetical protein